LSAKMEQKTLSAGVIMVRREGGAWWYLLLRAFQYWDFPKGVVEAEEDPLEAARREVEEETGLTELNFRWGHGFSETEPYGKGKIARYYVAETTQREIVLPISPELGHPEHHEYRWVSYQDGRVLLVPRVATWAHALISGETVT
jgi:8-oxo-dGTP pyrophosphatase MutT (NUDIX family)